jgi:hypothetical protein
MKTAYVHKQGVLLGMKKAYVHKVLPGMKIAYVHKQSVLLGMKTGGVTGNENRGRYWE